MASLLQLSAHARDLSSEAPAQAPGQAAPPKTVAFRAGAGVVDITPPAFPVRVNGMFTERAANRAIDPLYARALAFDDGGSQLVLYVVDTCMMPRSLIDLAKQIGHREFGLAIDRLIGVRYPPSQCSVRDGMPQPATGQE